MAKSMWRRDDFIYINRRGKKGKIIKETEQMTAWLYRPYIYGNASYASGVTLDIYCNDFVAHSQHSLKSIHDEPIYGPKPYDNALLKQFNKFCLTASLNPAGTSQYVNSIKKKAENLEFIGWEVATTTGIQIAGYAYYVTGNKAYKLVSPVHPDFDFDRVSITYNSYSKQVGRIRLSGPTELQNIDTALRNIQNVTTGIIYITNFEIPDNQLRDEFGCTTIQTINY